MRRASRPIAEDGAITPHDLQVLFRDAQRRGARVNRFDQHLPLACAHRLPQRCLEQTAQRLFTQDLARLRDERILEHDGRPHGMPPICSFSF
jgi:hypothetical protein